MYEDVEYLDVDNVEYMDCIDSEPELSVDMSASDIVCDNFIHESMTVRPVNAHSYLYEIFLLLVLCFLFLAKFLTKSVTPSNVLKRKMGNMYVRIKQLQSENSILRNSVKCLSSKFDTISTHLKNLEENVGRIFNYFSFTFSNKIFS